MPQQTSKIAINSVPSLSSIAGSLVLPAIPLPQINALKTVPLDQRMTFLQKYGSDSLAYSSLQKELNYYMQAGCGYIAYSLIGKDNIVPVCLANPICAIERRQELVENFLEKYRHPIFFHISKDTAHMLSQIGFSVNEVGTETIIDLQHFNIIGRKKEFLRNQINRGRREGLVIEEQRGAKFEEEDLRAISEEWMRKKVIHNRELSFIVRPAVYRDEVDVRKFIAYKDKRAIGFGIFDPIYRENQIIGYLANNLRDASASHYSIQDCITWEAMRVFKEEGKEILSLGFSPFYKVNDSGEFRYSRLLKGVFQLAYEHANYIYEFKSLAFHKSRYRPEMEGCEELKVYCAYTDPARFDLLTDIVSLMGVDLFKQTFDRLVRACG